MSAYSTVTQWCASAYDAVVGTSRRRKIKVDNRAEDRLLKVRDRDTITSNARSLRRNAAVAAWAIRKHLDYVSTFSFQCRSGDSDFDRKLESLMKWWARPQNCDATGRFSFSQLIRLIEASATVDGDAFVYKLADGTVQLVESDRVRTPSSAPKGYAKEYFSKFIHGVKTNGIGGNEQFAICDRGEDGTAYELREVIPSGRMYQHAYRDRYDQVRGVSPLSSGLNSFSDVYECQEFALAKMKLSQFFAVALSRAAIAGGDDENESAEYKFDFGAGPQFLDLDPGDKAEFLESATPSSEFQSFMQTGISIAIKSLDIPFSFFDESYTNYSGARQALLQYEQSCDAKRDRLIQLLNAITVWRISLWIIDGALSLPAGWTIDDITFEWIPAALPWLDPAKEANAFKTLLGERLTSRQRIAKSQGQDWFTICDELAAEDSYLSKSGLRTVTTEGEKKDADNDTANDNGTDDDSDDDEDSDKEESSGASARGKREASRRK